MSAQSLFEKGKREFSRGNLSEALEYFRKSLELEPDNFDCLSLIAVIYERQQNYESGLDCCLKILAIDPQSVQGHLGAGVMSLKIRDYESAVEHFDAVLEAEPENTAVLNELGQALTGAGNAQRAIECFQKSIETRPTIQIHENLAAALVSVKDTNGAIEHFRKANEIYLKERSEAPPSYMINFSRLVHDFEQLQFLRNQGIVSPQYDERIAKLRKIISRARQVNQVDRDFIFELSGEEIAWVAPFFHTNIFIGDGGVVSNGVLNPDNNFREIEQRFHSSHRQLIFVDNILTDEALEKVYRYLLESTIFRRKYNGYFGTTLASGLASPLIFQISEELQGKLPGIFKDYSLAQAWAFKYVQDMPGVDLHADFGAVQMNLWITPNEANLDPEGGGLVVWDVEAPKDSNFSDYQGNEENILRFLKRSNATAQRIPYRQNRGVIFNSALIHKTDDMKFRDGYENRRLNLTYTFGRELRI